MLTDPLKAVAWVEERHSYWCDRLKRFAEAYGVTADEAPAYEIAWRMRGKYAGIYCMRPHHTCVYVLPFVIVAGVDYDITIAHECCHAYQDLFVSPCEHHGETFFMLFHHVCGFKGRPSRHSYDVEKAQRISRSLSKIKELCT